ncbi:ankyrin-2 isoform X26 [Procambarus clarkii]|uniref:ankyrin-2 isoform X26 n=1 Tax=Procambarus clarkii TaxID=6728 RepID=UPI0037438F34
MAGKEDDEQEQQQQQQQDTAVRRGSKSIWPWKKETDGSASFLRAARAGNLEKVLEFLKTNTDIDTCNANGLNALHLASKEGHVNVVRELLQRGANVDAATKKGNTALHIASLAGQEEIVKVLVQHQALVNIQSQNGFTPLYMAAQENHDSVVRFLLANNANQSLATEDGFTPLAVALQQGHDKVVAVLLENDTRGKVRLPALHIAAKKDDTKAAALLLHTDHNPDVTSKSGFTPLHIAAHYGNENIANLLIQRGADVNYIAKHQITPLHVASKWGKGNMVSLLIDKGANYEAKTRDGLTPLHCAARSGHETVVDMLLEKGAPITSKTKNGLAPLHMASQGDHVDAARILLYHKAPVDDVTVDFLTALHVAAHCGHVRVAKLLLDRKADPNSRALNGFTPLHIACKKNRIKVVELLLKHGASIEATTESGLTPLHVASFMGCMNIVIYLIQHGASADVPTVRGETPLHLAARANQTDIIRILLRNGAQVDARAREQQTALHIASRLGNSDIVVLLLQHGAAVDATTKDHYTALHIAAKEGQEEVASVLLEHGASLTSTTKKGFTPLHLAAKYGNMKVARLLLQKDAPVDAQGKNGVTPLHVAAHYDHQNVALLLLDKGASPHATAKNGYTPLHIAARKNQMDIATTLLEYGASANAESKAGFTPLHLSSQEGHTDMATLLIEHNAAPGACAKNGLTPLHLCAQEDRVNVAAILVKHGAQIDPATKAGYTPLHVACHFGQMNMVRFLLQHGAKVDSTTQLGYTPLHQAAQQGHTQIVNLLLENKAEPNTETNDGKTALSIAQRLGYISVVETLKIVTETTINTTTTTVTEEKYKVVVPETMHETFMSESEDEGGDDNLVSSMFGKQQHVTLPFYEGQLRYTSDDTMLGDQSYRYLTVDEMKSLGDDSLPIDVTKDEKMDVSFISNTMAAPPVAPADQLSPQHQKEQHYAQFTGHYPSDNVDVAKTPILAGPESLNTTLNTTVDSAMIESHIESQIIQTKLAPQLSSQMIQEPVQHVPVQEILGHNDTDQTFKGQITLGQVTSVTEKSTEILNGWEGFLVSFMVDARGGAMRGCRHSGVRVIIPPRKAAMPMRVTCRYLKKDKLVHAPPLMEGEALASRILEMGPAGAKFLGPVIIEVPHFASLRGKEREIVILRSDNGETWREHTLEATEEAVQEVLNESFDGEELKQLEDLNTNRITRILTTDFPQYFAIVTRIRQEVHAIGPEGGMVSSTVVPQVQAVFPQGALTKKIKVGLQAQPIPTDLVAKLLGNRVAVSPIVTVEPRRRKFHKPITLTIPVPQASSKGMINQYSGEAPTLRLLCSITGVFRKRSLKGGTTRAQWEDVTGSTPLTFVNDCVSFTTTVSARFWLMDCSNIPEATKMATELYREAIHVPFMAKFVVFSKRHQLEEARVRVFCMTDDREDKTLEHQELFVEVAKSRDVEVLEGKPQFLEFAGNLVPVTKSGDQLAFNFYAFRENRLPFTVRVKDQHADPIGRVAFMRQPKNGRWKTASLISLLKTPVFQVGRGDPPQTPICNLNIALPDNIQPEPAPSEPDLLALEKKYSFLSIIHLNMKTGKPHLLQECKSKADTIHKADLRLTDISNMLGTDWVALAHELEISDSDINIIKSQYPDNAPQQAIVMLRLWMQTSGNKANGNTLEKGLRKIRRDDIVNQCIFNVELVTDDIERAMAKAHLDQSGFETFKEELGPSRDTTLNRDVSLDVSYDEQDMMKEAESAEEEEENQRAYQEKSSREQRTVDMSPTYESEEKKYAGEEKVVTEEKVTREELRDGSSITISTTSTTVIKEPTEKSKLDTVIKETTEVEPIEEMKLDSTKEQIIPEPIKEQIVPEPIKEQIVPEPIKEQIVPEPIKEQIVPEPIKEQIVPEPIKEQIVPEPIKEQIVPEPIEEIISEPMEEHISPEPIKEQIVPEPIKEQIVPEPIKETKVEPSVTEFVALKPVEGSAAETEEIISEEPLNILEKSKTEFTVAEAEKDMIEKYEQLLEQEALEKPIFKITEKPAEVEDKIEVVDDVPEDIGASEVEDSKEIQTTVVREVVSGPEGTPTSTTTTQRETYTTSEDGTVQEHIVVTKQITKTVGGLELDEEDKSLMLQKLGEELGRLDEKLEEKFKEKRKTDEPEVTQEEVKEEAVVAMRREDHAQPTSQVVVEYGSLPSTLSVTTTTTTTTTSITPTPDGFTQTSVESSQMSSTRGTAEVSFPGTTTTADESLKQMGQGTHEAAQLVEQQTPPVSYEEASSGHPTSGTKAGSAQGKNNLTEADLAVLESMVVAQEAEVEEMTFTHAQAEIQAEANLIKPDTDNMILDSVKSLKMKKLAKPSTIMEDPLLTFQAPSLYSTRDVNAASKATDTGQQLGDLTKRVADVASTMASTLESITAVAEGLEGSHLSSDEGEEQLMLMRDSPRWEDEEIQAEETDEPRAIKAEIKLLVKTTELGKESIEIRSIREFVECEDKNLTGFGGVVPSPSLECGRLTPMGDRVYTLQRASTDVRSPSPRFVRPQQPSTDSSYTEPTQDEFDLMAQVRDGGLHGGCPEAQGMDWEGKSVDSMYTETVVQAKLSMLPEVDTSEGVAPTSPPSSTLPPAASSLSTTSLCSDLPHITNIQPQIHTFQDLTKESSQTLLHLEPSHLHDFHSVESQGFDTSPSSATKLSDPIFLEKGHVSGAEATVSHLVTSPSFASLLSESVAPITGTDEIAAASVTFNTSSAFVSLGPISPTENSSEDHAEIDCTSTELSPDSVRFEQDILDTRTEDEAPDIDDDLFPASPVLGPELSERIFSVEATEDTDITTPMEMRDSHTERDASASNLEFVDDKEGTDLLKECLVEDKDESIAYLTQEVKEVHNKVNRLQEQVEAQVDPITASSEIKIILNSMEDIREAVGNDKIENNPEFNSMAQDILSNINSLSETVAEIIQKLHLSDPEYKYSEFWSKDETKAARRTESTIVETGSAEDGSPSDANHRDQSFSDLLDSEELNRDSLEEEFDLLAADLSLSPKATSSAAPSVVLSSPVSSNVYPSTPPDALQATQREPDVGVVFTEHKEYGGRVKPSAETTGGHSHISPSPSPHPSQSIQSSSFTSFQQKLPGSAAVTLEEDHHTHDECPPPSRPVRRHERTFSQASNIFTGAIPTEPKHEPKKEEKQPITEESTGITENIKPYSERKQFWESVTSHSFESKGSTLIKSETESDTDTIGTDGTIVERKTVQEKKVTAVESTDSETEYIRQRDDPAFYENAGFAGTERIDVPKEISRERAVSPFEVLRTKESVEDLPSPEDIAYKDVSSKRALFEKEIKRQSMEIEESQSWKRSSKEYDETVVITEELASSLLKKKEESEHQLKETIEKGKDTVTQKMETKKDDVSKTDIKRTEIKSKTDKTGSKEDHSETVESSKLHHEKMETKEKKVISEVSTSGKKSMTQTDASTEKKEKESTEKAAKVIHERKDSHSGTFSKTISKSEEKTESSSEAKETIHIVSTEDQDTSRDEITEEDMTRTEETSEEEPDDVLSSDRTTVNITEESRQVGDTHETVIRETTTTRDGDQEQRIIKETKTQETAMADGSTIKTTSITTFTTQLDTKETDNLERQSKTRTETFEKHMAEEPTENFQEEKHIYSGKTAKEKSEAFVEQRMKSDIFSEELSSSAEDQSPEHKVITPIDTKAPVSLQTQVTSQPKSPILLPKENVQEIVWEVSQEQSEIVMSETVQDIPVQQPFKSHFVKDISVDDHKKSQKTHRKSSSGSTKTKLSEEEARKLAIEIVEEVKTEAVKRSPLATPSQSMNEFSAELQDVCDGSVEQSLPRATPESAFTEETTTKIEKYIQEQLGDDMDEKQLKLIESVTARKTEMLHKKMVGSEYQQSMEITDEDLRSSGAELSPIEHQMERLRQMTEDDDNQRFPREPSEADESESSMIIHESVDDIISSEYDQANQMISKTLDALKTADINKIEKSIETIKEMPDTIVKTTVIVKEGIMSDAQELIKLKQSEVTETARKLVKEVTEKAKESEAVKQASLPTELRQASGSWEQSKSPSPKSGSKPSSRKGSWMDDDELRRDFRRDYEDKKKMFKEEMTSDKQDVFDGDAHGDKAEYSKITHQKSSESHKEIHMESSMTESMEESSTVESIRSFEGKLRPEVTTSVIKEQREVETEKKQEERSFSSYEEVVMRKKTHVDEFNRRSGTDFDTCSSSGESHYFTAAEGASDSRTASRPCSSDVEALMSERTGTSEYDTALTSQDTSQYSSYSTSSQDYRTPGSSLSSRDSMKSIDSESSGNLASVELSEASETLVPSAVELEKDMDLLEQELFEEELSHSTHHTIIPQLTIQSDTPKSEEMPCAFDVESDEGEFDQETKDEEREAHITSRMKRSIEMTFHPEPKPLTDDKKASVTESVASSLEESTLSEMSIATVIEQDKSMQGSTTDSNMSTSSVSEHMVSSVEGQEHDRHISRADSGVLTTETGDGDMALHSVTITATSVPSSTPDQNTASMCTQVTSETRSQVELTESEQFFHANGPTEVDYVPEYDDEEVQGARPVAASIASPTQEVAEAVAGPSEGPEKVIIVEECYETEADQEYGQMMRECEYSEMAEAELQYSLEEQPEAEMSSMLVIDEPLERPRTPEPGYVSSSRPSPMIIQSPDEPEEFTEVDKRFSAVFSTTYEEREEGASARSLVSGMSIDVPDITITEHTLPMPSQYCYPDLEREEDFPECRALAEADASAQEIPATPGSQESASSCPSRKSSSTDSEQGREYCLDDIAQGLPFESFEMVEAEDIDDFSEYERTLCMHEERMLEMSQIREEDEEEVEEARKTDSSPIQIPSQLKAVKLETDAQSSSDSQAHDLEDLTEVGPDPTIEEQRRWLELQFEESDAAKYDYPQGGFLEHVYSGPLEDIEEERDEAERRDLSHIAKTSSLSSTPEYDVLAGRKFFTRSGDHDDISMSSLQEFENLERAVAVEAVARRSSSGSQESLNGKRPESKSGQGDDISVGSFASLQEFERLERECLVVEQIEKKAQEEEAMLSEIEEGHESQVSESESCETLSEPGRGSVEGEEYDQRMFEIDEIIRQAQNNVERSDQNKPGYEGVQLKDIVSVDGSGDDGTSSSQADRTPSVGREDGDADSLEEAQLPELDMDHPAAGGTSSSTKQDAMTLSTDSIEALSKQKVPRETSQDSLEKLPMRTSDPMATSIDSIDLTSRQDPMTASTDSLEGRRKRQDPMSASTDSIDPCRRDGMTTSIDSLGRDDSSGRDADISSGSEQVRPLGKDGLMECSTDSLEPSSSQATHATYQYDTDSVMSGSFTSGCSNTLIASTDEFPDVMTSSMYLPEGQLPTEGDEQYVKYMHASGGSTAEMVTSSTEPGFSHSITRVVRLPPEAHKVTFTGPDAQRKLEEYIQEFNAGQHSSQDEVVDDQGNVHIRRVTQTRVVTDPSHIREHGFSLSEPSTQETETRDEYGNVTRVIRRTVVTSQTIEVDLDTGEPIIQPGPTSSSSSSSSFSRIPRPVTSPPLASRPTPPGPPPGSRGPHEPVPPSLEPNTVSDVVQPDSGAGAQQAPGLGVEEMSSVMESYTSDGSDPITTTHITRYDPDPLTTTTTTTTHTTRIIRRTQGEDGEVKEEIFEEY